MGWKEKGGQGEQRKRDDDTYSKRGQEKEKKDSENCTKIWDPEFYQGETEKQIRSECLTGLMRAPEDQELPKYTRLPKWWAMDSNS